MKDHRKVKSLVISAFPAMGKTHVTNEINQEHNNLFRKIRKGIIDIESEPYMWANKELRIRDLSYPHNYAQYVAKAASKYPIVLVSSEENVRKSLRDQNIFYVLVYPGKELKEEYIHRLIAMNKPLDIINFYTNNWDNIIDEMALDPRPKIVIHDKDLYIKKDLIRNINDRIQRM